MSLPVIDLFAGAGGLSIEATDAGCEVKASVELDQKACQTLRANSHFHGNVAENDVSAMTGDDLRSLAGLASSDRICCTNRLRDSCHESNMIFGMHEQLVPYEV
ncbi:MAG: DNA cytosine methyltransferase [Pseudomonadota bacterium]